MMKLLKFLLLLVALLVISSAAGVEGKSSKTTLASLSFSKPQVLDAHQDHRLAVVRHGSTHLNKAGEGETEEFFKNVCSAVREGSKKLETIKNDVAQVCTTAFTDVSNEVGECWKATKDGVVALASIIENNVKMSMEFTCPELKDLPILKKDLSVGFGLEFPNIGLDVLFPKVKEYLDTASISVSSGGLTTALGLPGSLEAGLSLMQPFKISLKWSLGLPVVEQGNEEGWKMTVFEKKSADGSWTFKLIVNVLWECSDNTEISKMTDLAQLKAKIGASEVQIGLTFSATGPSVEIKPTVTSPKVKVSKLIPAFA